MSLDGDAGWQTVGNFRDRKWTGQVFEITSHTNVQRTKIGAQRSRTKMYLEGFPYNIQRLSVTDQIKCVFWLLS